MQSKESRLMQAEGRRTALAKGSTWVMTRVPAGTERGVMLAMTCRLALADSMSKSRLPLTAPSASKLQWPDHAFHIIAFHTVNCGASHTACARQDESDAAVSTAHRGTMTSPLLLRCLPIISACAVDLGHSGMSRFSGCMAASAAIATRLPASFCRIESVL